MDNVFTHQWVARASTKIFADIFFLPTPTLFIAFRPKLNKDILGTIYSELETYYAGISLPSKPIRLSAELTLTDLPQFIHTLLNTLKAYNENQTYITTLKCLKYIENLLTSFLKQRHSNQKNDNVKINNNYS